MKLYWKLFIALFAAVLVGAGVLALLSQWRLDRGFVDYVNAADAELLPELAQVAARVYQRHDGWQAVREQPRLWFHALGQSIHSEQFDESPGGPRRFGRDGPAGPPPDHRRPPRPFGPHNGPPRPPFAADEDRRAQFASEAPTRPPSEHGLGPHQGPPPPPRRRRDLLQQRIAVVDTDGALVAGHFQPVGELPSAQIKLNGTVIGQLLLQPIDRPHTPEDGAFLLAQRDWLWQVVLVMLPIAALISYFLARHLLAPVQAISAAARRLASGDFQARVSGSSGDELGRLGEDFNSLGSAMAEHDSARRRWMADAAHELRTPLAVLQGEIEALQDGIRSVDQAALKALHGQTLQLATLVNDLQLLALADAGALNYQMEHVQVDECLLEAVEMQTSRLQSAGIHSQLLPAQPLRARILGDARRLRQLFDNLLENSRRYTSAPGQLQLQREIDGQYWTLHLQDSAPGVPAGRCASLFEAFVRDPERLREKGDEVSGSGLGLAICRRIVEAHGGRISAEPAALGGLAITLRLPLSR